MRNVVLNNFIPPLFFIDWISKENFSDLLDALGEMDVMRRLNYPGWSDLYKSILDFTKGKLPTREMDDICWVIEESKTSVFGNKKLTEKKKFFHVLCIFMQQI